MCLALGPALGPTPDPVPGPALHPAGVSGGRAGRMRTRGEKRDAGPAGGLGEKMAILRRPERDLPMPETVVDYLLDIAPSCMIHNDLQSIRLPVLECAHSEITEGPRYRGCVECKSHCVRVLRELIFED